MWGKGKDNPSSHSVFQFDNNYLINRFDSIRDAERIKYF